MSGKKAVEFHYSKMVESVLKLLKEEGFLTEVRIFKPEGGSSKMIHVDLAFEGGAARISQIKRVSKPGRRIYSGSKELKNALGKYGLTVVSTSQGVMKAADAKKKHLGGEVICEVF